MMIRSASRGCPPPPIVTCPLQPNLSGSPPFLVRAKGTGNLVGDRWVSQERGPWGLQVQDQGNFLYPSPPPLSSWLLLGGCLQHHCHLLLDFRNQKRAELVVVSGQLGDTGQGFSGTRSVQSGELVFNFRFVLK